LGEIGQQDLKTDAFLIYEWRISACTEKEEKREGGRGRERRAVDE